MLRTEYGTFGTRSGRPLKPDRQGVPEIVTLHLDEVLEFDQDRLVELVVAHGEDGTQKLVDGALREIATLTAELVHDLHLTGKARGQRTKQICDRIDSSARHVGLPICQRVVQDIRACHIKGDANARSAVLHRLVRLAARAMRQSWDIAEHWT